jgi:hypothetical protein
VEKRPLIDFPAIYLGGQRCVSNRRQKSSNYWLVPYAQALRREMIARPHQSVNFMGATPNA